MKFRMLKSFQDIFSGQIYRHRSSTHGDKIARLLYEDLYAISKSKLFSSRVNDGESAYSSKNFITGKRRSRRGDGAFGEVVPFGKVSRDNGFSIGSAELANLEIGVEVKILSKAMIKQIDRVQNDLVHQAAAFKRSNHQSITIGIVAVNHSDSVVSYEGERAFIADGSTKDAAPIKEAPAAIARITQSAVGKYDEFAFLPFVATNASPFPFNWVNEDRVLKEYSSLLIRVLRLYEDRFRGS